MTSQTLDDIDLSDADFWSRPLAERDAAFAVLRAQPHPVFFAEPDYADIGFPPGPGYYALVRHADVVEASRQPDVFSSARGGATNILDMPDEFAEYFGSMINMDNPRHTRLRRIVAGAFTQRMISEIGANIDRTAADVVEAIAERGACDFVTEVASQVPLRIICDMMGVPASQQQFVYDRSIRIVGGFDPEYLPDRAATAATLLTAGAELAELVKDLAAHRRQHPGDDLTSALATANIAGESLTDQEIGSFFILLAVAGNETTRNAITHGLLLLTENPDQQTSWARDFDRYASTAVEELLRLSSPIIFMRRKVTRDVMMNGHQYREDDKVLLFYWAANRDESVFVEPGRLDLTREPNPHVSFGGTGPHFCLGAHLARREITAVYRELLRRLPDIHAAGKPEPVLGSAFINGIKRLRCEFTPAGR